MANFRVYDDTNKRFVTLPPALSIERAREEADAVSYVFPDYLYIVKDMERNGLEVERWKGGRKV